MELSGAVGAGVELSAARRSGMESIAARGEAERNGTRQSGASREMTLSGGEGAGVKSSAAEWNGGEAGESDSLGDSDVPIFLEQKENKFYFSCDFNAMRGLTF